MLAGRGPQRSSVGPTEVTFLTLSWGRHHPRLCHLACASLIHGRRRHFQRACVTGSELVTQNQISLTNLDTCTEGLAMFLCEARVGKLVGARCQLSAGLIGD